VNDYSVEVKPAARKELEALPDNVLIRIMKENRVPGQYPTTAGMQEAKGL